MSEQLSTVPTLIDGRPESEIIDAIAKGLGIKTAIAKRLGCARHTLNRWIKDHPSIAAAFSEAEDILLDTAEHKLVEQVLSGDIKAIKYLLDTKGKSRGYGQPKRLEIKAASRMSHEERQARFGRVAAAMGYSIPTEGVTTVIDVTAEDEDPAEETSG